MRTRGSITVEAAVILPFYILLLVFLANFLNIYYTHQAIQHGLHNAGNILAQYCYAVDLTVGMDSLTLSEETSDKIDEITSGVEEFSQSAQDTLALFEGPISLEILQQLVDNGKEFVNATGNLVEKFKDVSKDDVVNVLFSYGAQETGGFLVKLLVENYLDNLQVKRSNITGDIHYSMYISTDGNYNLVLQAAYTYNDPIFSVFTEGFQIQQQVVVHPWIGGETPALRGS